MLDRMYKEYPRARRRAALEALAGKIRAADAFVFVDRRIQLGRPAGAEEPDRPLPGGVVLAAGGHRQLFRRTLGGRAVELRLARHPVRDGHGGDLQHPDGGPIARRLDGEGKPIGDGGAALDPRLRPLRRRPGVVDAGGQGPAVAQGAPVLMSFFPPPTWGGIDGEAVRVGNGEGVEISQASHFPTLGPAGLSLPTSGEGGGRA